MFDRVHIHAVIALVWIIMFALLWWVFQTYIFDVDVLASKIVIIEDSIQEGKWEQADLNYQQLKKSWQSKRIGFQFNNGTQVVGSFERELAQLGTMLGHKQKNALQFIGGLKQDLKTIATVFPGP